MPNKLTTPEIATTQFAGNPYRLCDRRKKQVLEHPYFSETSEKLNDLIQKYNCKYCFVSSRKDGLVNIKFKILKRVYFFALEEDFPKAVKKLSDIVEKYYVKRMQEVQ